MELEDDERNEILQMDGRQLYEVARYVNRYPSIDVKFGIRDEDELVAGSQGALDVKLIREVDEEDDEVVGPVIAPFFPHKKDEGWWIVIDSYSGCDQEFDLPIKAQEGAEDSEEEDEAMET
ncbi:unnamed protein product [Rhizophagus irregularis]|nr:unnamed protein product [Rhizophagus irregularis]